MVPVDWTQSAAADLEQIFEYIARGSARYARITVERITRSTARLARFPELGQILPEHPQTSYRQLIVRNYRVIYRFDSAACRVIVVAVVHASRILPYLPEG